MFDTIITVENLSKRYKLGTIGATTLRDSVERGWHRLRGRDWRHHMGIVGSHSPQRTQGTQRENEEHLPNQAQRTKNQEQEPNEFWALKDASFEVKRGEVLGVIGRNGAGKSTLLKILTRITEPTCGRAIMRGRVASLLEVGTGFHPELSGRENVYLNGAILGMKRAEITQKFDEIVAFAEVEKFIDTPVKRYSSGMHVRLAFAVAAHLDAEIMLVDEVLAVGDAAFQNKCLGKIREVAGHGRTTLFVSHSMGSIRSLCTRVIVLKEGMMVADSDPDCAIASYLNLSTRGMQDAHVIRNVSAEKDAVLSELWFETKDRKLTASVPLDGQLIIGVKMVVRQLLRGVDLSVRINNYLGIAICTASLSDENADPLIFMPGTHSIRAVLPSRFLVPGLYFVTIAVHRPRIENIDVSSHELSFHVEDSGGVGWSSIARDSGSVFMACHWIRELA
jgi:lipopolysaccharide transport system ATP-binding protein